MAVSVVASSAQGVTNGVSLTFTYPTVADGDIAIVGVALTRASAGTVTSSAGTSYTNICPTVTNGNLNLNVWARRLSSFETTGTASATGSGQDGNSFCYTIIRGAGGLGIAGMIESSGATGTSTAPNSPAVTVGSTSAIAISIAAQIANNTVSTLPSGYSSGANAGATDTRSSRIALSLSVVGSEQTTEDPGAWNFSASAAWVAFTVALISSGSVYFPLPDQLRDPPEIWPEMIGYGGDIRSS